MIINSLLDTDLYKFTMMQVVLHQFPAAKVEYRFKCRTPNVDFRPFISEIRKEIQHFCSLQLQQDELDYLSSLRYIKSDFIDFLHIFRLNSDFITIEECDEFNIIIRGPWLHTIMFEVPILAIISEVYFRNTVPDLGLELGRTKLDEKIALVKNSRLSSAFIFSDFGTRRRFSFAWHREIVRTLSEILPNNIVGTSNVLLAKEFGLTPIGTMAHEYLQACQSLGPRLVYSQKFAFQRWADEYRGDLGIALSDVYTTDAFIKDFDLYFCKLFDGARQDSGDPFLWGDRIIEHYESMRIDPKTKTLVFSDGLDFPKALELLAHFHDRTNPVFGIGTNLTNDVGVEPLQNVIKMTLCNEQPVAKLSDTPDKTMCQDASYLAYLKEVFNV